MDDDSKTLPLPSPIEVGAADYLGVMTSLRDESGFGFEEMVDLCGVDYSAYGDGASARERIAGRSGGRVR